MVTAAHLLLLVDDDPAILDLLDGEFTDAGLRS